MVIEALKAARDFIENDRQALAESLTVNGEIVFEDDTDRRAMAEYVNVLVVIDEALEQALAAPVQPVAWLIPGSITTDPELAKANGDKAVALGKISTQQWNAEDHYKDGWRDALESVKRAAPPAAPVQDAENKWRTLALQFDAHRMSALAHLRAMVQDPAKHAEVAGEFLSAPPPGQPAVPEGWKLVPVEPTGEMLAALAQEWHSSRYEAFRGRYALMLAAAPEKGQP